MKYLNKSCIESTGHVYHFTRWGDLKKKTILKTIHQNKTPIQQNSR